MSPPGDGERDPPESRGARTGRDAPDQPPHDPPPGGPRDRPPRGSHGVGVRGSIGKLRRGEGTWVIFVREMITSVLIVLLIGVLLYGVSGVWPPMVAVESGSMEPHMHRGDLVFLMEEHRLAPGIATADTGVVTYRAAARSDRYRKFGAHGDVIVFRPDGAEQTPIIHRARFWVNESENWYDKADPDAVVGRDCDAVPNCPAPHAGFITKGDANPQYDQVSEISGPVRPRWIRGTAEVRVPWLGYVRLEVGAVSPSIPG